MTRPPAAGRRSRAAILLLLVALMPAAALVPGGAAQSEELLGDGWPRADARLVPVVEHEEEVLGDPTGDAALFGEAETPENGMEAATDIVSLKIGEDAGRFLLSLAHRAYDDTTYQAKDPLLGRYTCQIGFSFAADRDTHYTVMIENHGLGAQGELDGSLWKSEDAEDDDYYRYYYGDHVASFQAFIVDGQMEMVLEKDWFRIGARERLVTSDDVLRDLSAECQYTLTFFSGWHDEVDRESAERGSGRYQVQIAAGSGRLGIDVAEDVRDRTVFTAAPGQAQKIPLVIENKMDRKNLVNLTVQLTDGTGAILEGWKAVLTPTVEVRANNTTQATLIVTPPTDAAHREAAQIQVVGRLLGFDDEVRLGRTIMANVAPSAERSVLHFHNADHARNINFCIMALCNPDQARLGGYEEFFLNVLEDDPVFDDGSTEAPLVRLADDGVVAYLDLPLSRELRLDPEGTIDLDIALSAAVEHDVEMEIDLFSWDGETYLGSSQRTVTVGQSADTHTFRIIPREEALTVPAGTTIVLAIETSMEAGFSFDGIGPGLSWAPDDSTLTFPLLPLPEPDVELTDGRALPTIQFRNQSEREEYVNPGKSRVYELALVNEGVEKDILEVRLDPDRTDWSLQVRPGTRFELEPGTSAPFAVVVTPPEDAEEGDILNLNLTAKSANDDKVRSTVTLKAIVTTNVEYTHEDYQEPTDEEKVEPYVEKAEESPLAVMPWVVVGMVVGLATARRRR